MDWGVKKTAGELRLALRNAEELSPGIPARKAGRGEGEVKASLGLTGAEGLDAGQATDTALRGTTGRIQSPGANTPLAGGDLSFQDKSMLQLTPHPGSLSHKAAVQAAVPQGRAQPRCLLDARVHS